MKTSICLIFFAMSYIGSLTGQSNYTKKQFADRVQKDIVYGYDTLYSGFADSLKLDLYTPVNDSNCKRPIMVIVHGGAWLGGDKAGGVIPQLCHEFTARGYLVASLNYRMGMHPTSNYTPYAICPHEKCSYVADTAEWYRAAYRAAQDVKSAVRFLKNRAYMDSSDAKNVFLLGESAGAFTVYLAAWLDKDSEKFAQTKALTDAPNPDSDLLSCVVAGTKTKRPDLGPITGIGNLDNEDSKVKGVAAFYGGVLDTSIFRQSHPTDTPVLYMYHQSCDVVVDNNKGRVFWKTFYYCYAPLNLCQPYISVPMSWGSSAIKKHLDSMTGTKPRNTFTYVNRLGSYSCDPSANCHGIDNVPLRTSEVADFFAPVIAASGNAPKTNNCNLSKAQMTSPKPRISPNPTQGHIWIQGLHAANPSIRLITSAGKAIQPVVNQITLESYLITLPENLAPGVYSLNIQYGNAHLTQKIVYLAQ